MVAIKKNVALTHLHVGIDWKQLLKSAAFDGL